MTARKTRRCCHEDSDGRAGEAPRITEVENELQALQGVVGGYIEVIAPWPDPVLLVCDEDGMYKATPWNRGIKGTFFLCGVDGEDFTDFPEELVEKYKRLLA